MMETPTLRRGNIDKGVHEMSDKYTASIELSNACRHFYNSRIEAAANMKLKIQERCVEQSENPKPPRKRRGINEAMDKLREEMVALMDQDLTLMKQLLNLNETIEDLKWQRSNYYSGSSSEESDFSVSETEMYADSSDNDSPLTRNIKTVTNTIPRRSSEGGCSLKSTGSCRNFLKSSHKRLPQKMSVDITTFTTAKTSLTTQHKGHPEYRSFDSGINESDHIEIRV